MELLVVFSISFLIIVTVVGLHLGIGAFISSKLMVRDSSGDLPWLNSRNVLIVLALIVLFSFHLAQSGIIGGS